MTKMPPKQRIALEKRGMIIALHQEWLNQRDILYIYIANGAL